MNKRFFKKQRGMSLLEVVVSMLICGIGLAGMLAAVQASQRLALSADYRAIATREIQSAVDMMRANRLGADKYIDVTYGSRVNINGNTDAGLAICKDRTAVNTNARQYCEDAMANATKVAAKEAELWKERVKNALPGGIGTISAEQKGGIYVFTVKIEWKIANENKTVSDNPADDAIQMSFSL